MTINQRRSAGAVAPPKNSPQGLITAWSYSRLRTYRQCPKKARFLYVDKLKEPESEPMAEGTRVHSAAEHYLKGTRKDLDPVLAEHFRPDFDALLKKRKFLRIEAEICFALGWRLVSWFAKDAWCRIKIDALLVENGVARVIDYKTGKEKDEDLDQLDLYAIAVFELEPTVQEVHVELWYTQTGAIAPCDPKDPTKAPPPYKRSQLAALKKKWEKAPKAMLADRTFAEKPSKLCDYCFFGQAGKAKGGPGLCPR